MGKWESEIKVFHGEAKMRKACITYLLDVVHYRRRDIDPSLSLWVLIKMVCRFSDSDKYERWQNVVEVTGAANLSVINETPLSMGVVDPDPY